MPQGFVADQKPAAIAKRRASVLCAGVLPPLRGRRVALPTRDPDSGDDWDDVLGSPVLA